MKKLKTVTLLAIDGTGDDILLDKAIKISSKLFKFNEIIKITKLMTSIECQKFTVTNINKFVNSDFCIIIQSDGFILNSDAWTDEFFEYDYIGAPWIFNQSINYCNYNNIKCENTVGNGGFSLRSKKFLEESSNLTYDNHSPEDAFLCLKSYDTLVGKGIKFCNSKLASKFSTDPFNGKSFGFHGNKNLINQI